MSWRRLLLAAKNSKYIFPGHKDLLVLIQGFSDLINYASVVIYKQRCNLACLSVFLSEQCCGIFRSLLIGCCGCFTVFESVVAYKKDTENVMILVISWQKSNIKHPRFEIPNRGLAGQESSTKSNTMDRFFGVTVKIYLPSWNASIGITDHSSCSKTLP